MSKKVEISRDNYNLIKDIIKNSSCYAVAYEKVQEQFNLNREQAYKITNAVANDYKYLKIVD
jgi:hypothetical protein